MATPTGFAFFTERRVNNLLKAILDKYGEYLKTEESCDVLVTSYGGWFSPTSMAKMPGFVETFNCDTTKEHWGFTSFDDFFTRTLRADTRPVGKPDDPYTVVNACENTPYKISYGVKLQDEFWIKSQPYCLQDIFDGDPLAERFAGGTIYQGFLSAHTYHRFHAPVSGKLVRKTLVAGTYFAHPSYSDGSVSDYVASQPYLAHVATRAIIIIDAEDTTGVRIGLVAFVPIEMVEISSVDLSPLEGKSKVTKGENIGTFISVAPHICWCSREV